MVFSLLSSAGSSPSSSAAKSMVLSITKAASGLPAPRYGVTGLLFVKTPVTLTQIAGIV